MITFKQFLKEDEEITLSQVISECKPFLKAAQGEFIMRGIKHPTGDVKITIGGDAITAYRMAVRTDRRPLHSNEITHLNVDDYIMNKFGWRGRSAGLFVAGDGHGVAFYGDPYIILPRGDFKFVWSPITSDLLAVEFDRDTDIDQTLEDLQYTDEDLPTAIKSGHEIMLSCRDYYAIPNSSIIREIITDLAWR